MMDNNDNKQLMTTQSQQRSELATIRQSKTDEISVYHDPQATDNDITQALSFLNATFTPQNNPAFVAMFARLVRKQKMTRKQLSDAVELLIMTNHYQTWKIADVVGYNPTIKIYTQSEVYKHTGQYPSPLYPKVKIGNTEALVSLSDAQTYNLEIVRSYSEYV